MAWGGARPGAGAKKAAAPAAAGASDKPPAASWWGKISDTLLGGARTPLAAKTPNPFALPDHPPGARPPVGMAMDDSTALTANISWAAGALSQVWSEGLTFLGYAFLAELAQRPEYRVIIETIATEMTRKWISLQAKGDEDKTKEIAQLNDELERLRVRDVFREAAEQDGAFGRSHIYLDFGTTGDADELKTPIGNGRNSISAAKVGKGSLQRLKSVEAVWCYPMGYNSNDPLRADWYKPTQWFVMSKEVHASRLLTFIGREVPDMLKPAYSFGGLSMSQMAKPYVDNWLRTRKSVGDLVHAFSVMILKTNLAVTLQAGSEQLFRRTDLFTHLRDNRGLMMLDKDTEDLANVTVPLSTLDMLQAQSQEQMAAVSRIPLVKLLGIQPAGLNASSEGEITTFDDNILSYQEKLFREPLTAVIGFAQLSLWGKIDPDIVFVFEPLRSLTEKEIAEKQKTEAETDQIHIDSGVLHPVEARKRVANDPDTPYASLDVEDVPELAEEEEAGLEPGAGAEPDDGRATAEDAILPFAHDAALENEAGCRE